MGGSHSADITGGARYGYMRYPDGFGSGGSNSTAATGGAGGGALWLHVHSQLLLEGNFSLSFVF